MFTHWILILIVYSGAGVATTTASFYEQKTCEAAGKAIKQAKSWGTVDFVCTQQ